MLELKYLSEMFLATVHSDSTCRLFFHLYILHAANSANQLTKGTNNG